MFLNFHRPGIRRVATGIAALLALTSLAEAQRYTQTNVVSSIPGLTVVVDPNMKNAWGMSRSSASPWWISDNHTGLSTLYINTGAIQSLVVTVPAATDGAVGSPTGTIYNGTTDFQVGPSHPAVFLFATEDGTISGWNSGVNPNTAIIKVKNTDGSSYKGLTSSNYKGKNYLYAANFTMKRVDVFDASFAPVSFSDDQFQDPFLPDGYGPFNVQAIGENIYVVYAQVGSDGDAVLQDGLGLVEVFTPNGTLLRRFQPGNHMNAPWGIVHAPSDFGRYSNDILVGNFGSGKIAAFNSFTGRLVGWVEDANGDPLVIDGLWGLSFGNNGKAGSSTALWFTAGPNQEADGLFGFLTPVSTDQVYGNDR